MKWLCTIAALLILCACRPSIKEDMPLAAQTTEKDHSVSSTDHVPGQWQCSSQVTLPDGGVLDLQFNYTIHSDHVEVALSARHEDMAAQNINFVMSGLYRPTSENIQSTLVEDDNFQDLNFDGYPDYHCLISQLGRSWNYSGWVFDPDEGLYRETNLFDIPNMQVNKKDQTIRGGFFGAGGGTDSIYKYEDSQFIETNCLNIIYEPFTRDSETGEITINYWEENGILYGFHEYRLEDGEMVEVWPQMICDTEEGREQIREHLFGADSIWFPSGSFA